MLKREVAALKQQNKGMENKLNEILKHLQAKEN
jgi:hypothetical protein